MKDFFTLDGKIEENRRFLRETQDKYEKIRNYYPLFFIYIGFIGVYTFDILTYFISSFSTNFTTSDFILGVLLLGHIVLFGCIFWMFSKILVLKDIAVELCPKELYKQIDEVKINLTQNFEDSLLEESAKKVHLKGLEKSNEDNLKILVSKKRTLSKIILMALISFILYISLITFYKIQKMTDTKKPEKVEVINLEDLFKPNVGLIKDGKEVKGNLLNEITNDSLKIKKVTKTELKEMVREIIREEIKKEKEESK